MWMPCSKSNLQEVQTKRHFAHVSFSAILFIKREWNAWIQTPGYGGNRCSWQNTVDIQAANVVKIVMLTVDTGVSVSVLPWCIYEEHFKEAPLHKTST